MSQQPSIDESEMRGDLAAMQEDGPLEWREVAKGAAEWVYDHSLLVLRVEDGMLPSGRYALVAFGDDS